MKRATTAQEVHAHKTPVATAIIAAAAERGPASQRERIEDDVTILCGRAGSIYGSDSSIDGFPRKGHFAGNWAGRHGYV